MADASKNSAQTPMIRLAFGIHGTAITYLKCNSKRERRPFRSDQMHICVESDAREQTGFRIIFVIRNSLFGIAGWRTFV